MATEAATAAVILRIQSALFALASTLAKKISELVTAAITITAKNKLRLVDTMLVTIQSSTRRRRAQYG